MGGIGSLHSEPCGSRHASLDVVRQGTVSRGCERMRRNEEYSIVARGMNSNSA
jgi:hypothetical protein